MISKAIIKQTSVEEVTSTDIKNISKIVDSLEADSILQGTVHTNLARIDYVDKINERFPDLTINTNDIIILESDFNASENAIIGVIYAKGKSSHTDMLVLSEAKLITATDTWFRNNANVTDASFYKFLGLTKASYGTFDACTNLTTIKLSDSVTTIGGLFASSCSKLNSINLKNIRTIGGTDNTNQSMAAFKACTSLEEVDLSNVEFIGFTAFKGCTNLTIKNNTLPKITYLGNECFANCSNITNLYIPVVTIPTLYGQKSFPTTTNFTVPESMLDLYASTTNWMQYWNNDRIKGINTGSKYVDINTITPNASAGIVGFVYKCLVSYNPACNPEQKNYTYTTSTDDVEFDGTAIILINPDKDHAEGTITVTSTSNPSVSGTANFYVYDDGTSRTPIVDATRNDGKRANDIAIMEVAYTQGWSTSAKKMFEGEAAVANMVGAEFNKSTITSFDILKYFTNVNGLASKYLWKSSILGDGSGDNTARYVGVFNRCTNLKSVDLPSNITYLASSFSYSGLERVSSEFVKNISVAAKNEIVAVNNGPRGCFEGCTALVSASFPNLENLGVDKDNMGDAVAYGHGAGGEFSNCTSLTTVNLGRTEMIGSCSFYKDTKLVNVSGIDSVKIIGKWAFYECQSLVLSLLPSGVTKIGKEAFYKCSKLALVSLPETVTNLGYGAFNLCSEITLTQLPTGITSIKDYTFYGCSKLALTSLPEGVTGSIGNSAFYNCTKLAITSIPSGVTSIGLLAFMNCKAISISSLPEGLTLIGINAFNGCSGMASPLTIPSSVTYIGSGTFANSGITELTILTQNLTGFSGNETFNSCLNLIKIDCSNSTLKCFSGNAFINCQKLLLVKLPTTWDRFNLYVFLNCTSLKAILVPCAKVANIESTNSFNYCNLLSIYVHDDYVDLYKSHSIWKNVANIIKPISEYVDT